MKKLIYIIIVFVIGFPFLAKPQLVNQGVINFTTVTTAAPKS